ncbi:MAG: (d)CMP kinase [Candidatus Hydrogenedentes bacterium]|jgi:cytidylate kinase|nr:(d)CMP kinase [Candidatus Hydrogenedentota bacterium]
MAADTIVAIDGPAASGKSTIARRVAKALGYAFLDTGAMYRAATWRALRDGVDLEDREALVKSTRAMDLSLSTDGGTFKVMVDGQDVTAEIRAESVTSIIRALDAIPEVRERLVGLQREFGSGGGVVAEGRDMGTVVFPLAKCKIFLDASLETRTKRRAEQLREQGAAVDEEALRASIYARDESDRNRGTAPLCAASDAYALDTTSMSLDEVEATILERARAAL